LRSIAVVFLAVSSAAACLCCRAGPDVTRLVNGRPIEGHFIEPSAYSAYLQGALLEQNGGRAEAQKAYARAVTEDPNAAEAWARLGAIQCLHSPRQADAALARAARLGRNIEQVFIARSECELERGKAGSAVQSAEKAAELAPDDVEASLAVARALERAGRIEDARRWVHALALRSESSLSGLRATIDLAARTGTTPHGRLAGERIELLIASLGGRTSEEDARTALDNALAASDLSQARAAALRAHLSGSDLATRAYELGRFEIALEVASRVLGAEPGNTDARIVAIASAITLNDDRALERALIALPAERTPVGEGAAHVMEALLRRRLGEDAARAWSTATGSVATPAPPR
jgi:hypothetical protein